MFYRPVGIMQAAAVKSLQAFEFPRHGHPRVPLPKVKGIGGFCGVSEHPTFVAKTAPKFLGPTICRE